MTENANAANGAHDLEDIGVHPVADLFPMLAADELKELAADIKARGLLQPIVLDVTGRILDGRNRYAACKLAGIEPSFVSYEGDDPDGYALAVNIARRHLTKGQIAMVAAQALLKNSSQKEAASRAGVSQQYVGHAQVVLKFAPDLADAVSAGTKPLNEAYEVARERKREKDALNSDIALLRAEAADLADQVTEERLTLTAALKLLDERRRDLKLRDEVAEYDVMRNADGAPPPTFCQRAEDGSVTWAEALTLAKQWRAERDDAVRRHQSSIRNVVSGWGAIRTVLDSLESPYVADILAGLGDRDREELERITAEWRSRNGA
ncbi:ParB/RepB/Spo0J family partition protein [Nonomuraea sp. MTCD27]|uniref:ParB/RepB/Spo0J family partition protein n=1 Tax=Nonomuraea sp. MTCD27 TaxID=1676747 RepID=UPI0035BF85F2